MVIALYGVAFAMVVGGLAALSQGYGIIMVERGWTMVIAGTTAVAGGAILAGIAYTAAQLVAIQGRLATLGERLGRADETDFVPDTSEGSILPRLAGALKGASPAALAAAGGDFEPALDRDAARASAQPEKEGDDAVAEPPRVEPPARVEPVRRSETARPGRIFEEADVWADEPAKTPELPPRPDRERSPLRSAPESATGPRPGASGEPAPTIIGTYDSGGNRYVMYSDGSIEADTPSGVFRFKSLDELKEFIAAGGESGNQQAAWTSS